MSSNPLRSRIRAFGALAVLAVLAIAVAILVAHRDRQSRLAVSEAPVVSEQAAVPLTFEAVVEAPVDSPPVPTQPVPLPAATTGVAPPRPEPASSPSSTNHPIFFRHTALDSRYGMLAFRVGEHGALQFAGDQSCEAAYVGRQVGICLAAKRGVVTRYYGRIFDAVSFVTRVEFELEGTPSRTRISPDGKHAAFTVFLAGHGYDTLDFSTQTLILEAASGTRIADLEMDFSVQRDGVTIKAQDFNFWGVTFPGDSNTFYATLSTDGRHYLVRGDVAARRMVVLHENVECPSVSPDGQRIAYKKRFIEGGRIVWQLNVLDLASGRETSLAERRSIDDQLEWLDDGLVLYSVPSENQDAGGGTDVWVARADGTGVPRRFIPNAYSPSVVR